MLLTLAQAAVTTSRPLTMEYAILIVMAGLAVFAVVRQSNRG